MKVEIFRRTVKDRKRGNSYELLYQMAEGVKAAGDEPIIVNDIPRNLPSKFGDPVKIYTPTNAIDIPIKALTVGFSLSIKYAKITPKGTSV